MVLRHSRWVYESMIHERWRLVVGNLELSVSRDLKT